MKSFIYISLTSFLTLISIALLNNALLSIIITLKKGKVKLIVQVFLVVMEQILNNEINSFKG